MALHYKAERVSKLSGAVTLFFDTKVVSHGAPLQRINIDSPLSPPFQPFIIPLSIGLLDKSLGFGRQEFPSSNCCRLCSISSTPFYPYSPFFYSSGEDGGSQTNNTNATSKSSPDRQVPPESQDAGLRTVPKAESRV